jgi:hypothetical protein
MSLEQSPRDFIFPLFHVYAFASPLFARSANHLPTDALALCRGWFAELTCAGGCLLNEALFAAGVG